MPQFIHLFLLCSVRSGFFNTSQLRIEEVPCIDKRNPEQPCDDLSASNKVSEAQTVEALQVGEAERSWT